MNDDDDGLEGDSHFARSREAAALLERARFEIAYRKSSWRPAAHTHGNGASESRPPRVAGGLAECQQDQVLTFRCYAQVDRP